MKALRHRKLQHCRAAALLLVALGAGCNDSAPPQEAGSQAVAAAAAPTATPRRESLPRSIAGVELGMNLAGAEEHLGDVTCRDGKAGVRFCGSSRAADNGVNNLEVSMYHDRIISLAYEIDPPRNPWEFLDRQMERFGQPSLSGRRSRDRNGRDHEIFGWKDGESLYSVRFIWGDSEPGHRDLIGTAITLWDRRAYQEWEKQQQGGEESDQVGDAPSM